MGAGIRKKIDVDKLPMNSASIVHKSDQGAVTQFKRNNIGLVDLVKRLEQEDPFAKPIVEDAEKGKKGLARFWEQLRKGFK